MICNSEKNVEKTEDRNFGYAKISIPVCHSLEKGNPVLTFSNSLLWIASSLLLAMTALMFFPNPTSAATITMPPNNLGLVGYWSFEDATGTVATDFSGNRNHGTLTNVTNADWVAGKIGKALDFDATNDNVLISDNDSLDFGTSDFSVSAWIKRGSGADTRTIITKRDGSFYGWIFYQGDGRIGLQAAENGGSTYAEYTDVIINTNEWYHVVGVGDRTNGYKIYVNGALKSTSRTGAISNQDGSISNSANVYVGQDNSDRYFDGQIDDVRLYSRALSATEIGKLYSNPKRVILQAEPSGVISTGMVGYWPFNGASVKSTTVYDRSGYNNNGTLLGGAGVIRGLVAGQAVYFDGVNDYILVPHSESLTFNRFQPFTISVLLTRYTYGTEDVLVAKYSSPGGSDEYGYRFFINTANKLSFELRAGDINNRILVATDNAIECNSVDFTCQLSVTYDGSSNASGVKLYIDNQLKASTAEADTLSGDITINNPDLTIGIDGDLSNGTRGIIDDVRIYNRVVPWGGITSPYARNRFLAGAYTPAAPSYDFSTLSNGLIQHITFDTVDYDSLNFNFVDRTEYVKDGTYSCDNGYISCPSLVSGKRGQAVVLDRNHLAVDDSPAPLYITLTKPTTTSSVSAITFSFWAKDGATSDFQVLADFASSVGIHNPNNTGGFSIQAGVSGVILNILDNIPVSAVWREIPFTGNRDTSWHLYTFTTNGTTVKTYYDGSLVDTYTLSYNLDLSVYYSFTLGATQQGIEYSSNGYYFTGNIDDLRVYDRALSASEITALYNYVD